MKKFLPLFLSLLTSPWVISQEASSAKDRLDAFQQRTEMIGQSEFSGVVFRSVGPTVMSGRVVDIDVNPIDPTHFFVAYASGGLWETSNNGQSFLPLFDEEAVMTIGDIAVNWQDTSIWVGTGEVNSSRSSYAGVGLYFSADKGASWTHKGLSETQHIGRIIIRPGEVETVWVASLGPLYSEGGEEGLFMTEDGGTSWAHVLDKGAGAVDLVIDPLNPDILYASLWDRSRAAWNFQGHGPKSGIYESKDGGKTWSLITSENSGFPIGEGVGRIGLDMSAADGKSFLYAIHDNQNRRPEEEEDSKKEGLGKEVFKTMTAEEFLKLKETEVSAFLEENRFPREYDYDYVRNAIEQEKVSPVALFDFLSDANTDLFDTPVIGPEVYRRDGDTGKWSKTHDGYIDDLVYSYGYYFGTIRVRPGHPQEVYIAGVPLLYSSDGGKNFEGINPENVHADHHALWINPNREGHLINGNDGGINISYDNGLHYSNCNSPAVGQFYTVQVDNARPYNVYGGLQDNGVWRGPSDYEVSGAWHQTGQYPYEMLLGGDGMQIAVDPRDNETIYTGYQFGHYYRIKEGQRPLHIHPHHELGEKPLRWNWQTPIQLSSHNSDILYIGSNKTHRSLDKGENWETISEDLTHGGKEGNVPFGTLTSIDESILKFGMLLTGSDDGLVHLSQDGGHTWTNISAGLPPNLWVSRVRCSQHEQSRLYVTLNGYRNDHHKAYVFKSEDLGATWTSLGMDLPSEAVNVILEDDKHENILYLGTDHGLYMSPDLGQNFTALMNGIPHVPVHDLVIQEREQELVVGTHGRSIYIADLDLLRGVVSSENREMQVFLKDSLKGADRWGRSGWSKWFGSEEPELIIPFYEREEEACHVEIRTKKGSLLKLLKVEPLNGLQSLSYDLRLDDEALTRLKSERKRLKVDMPNAADNGKTYLDKGLYTVNLVCGAKRVSHTLIID